MSYRTSTLILTALAAALTLPGCTDLKRAIGMERVVPDEFAVVSRAPLAIPPDLTLRPPRPGAPRSQETAPVEQARQSVFRAAGDQQVDLPPAAGARSQGEGELLRQAHVTEAPSNIRELVNEESTSDQPVDDSFVNKLLFWRGPDKTVPANQVIDPEKEAVRLKDRQAAGKPAAAEVAAPVIERTRSPSLFERLF